MRYRAHMTQRTSRSGSRAILLALLLAPVPATSQDCAGNVEAKVSKGALFIVGDDQANCIHIDSDTGPSGSEQNLIMVGFGTTVNGAPRFVTRHPPGM